MHNLSSDHPGEGRNFQLGGEREDPRLDELARLRPHDGGAKDRTIGFHHRLYEAFRLPFRDGTIIFRIGPSQDFDFPCAKFCRRFRFGQAHMGKLGIGVGHMGHGAVVRLRRHAG